MAVPDYIKEAIIQADFNKKTKTAICSKCKKLKKGPFSVMSNRTQRKCMVLCPECYEDFEWQNVSEWED